MLPSDKFRNPYSAEECALLLDLRSRENPPSWSDIRDQYFPTRTAEGLKTKWADMTKGQRPVGRPRGKSKPAESDPIDSKRFNDMSEAGSIALGLAIDRCFFFVQRSRISA